MWDSQNEHWMNKNIPDNVRAVFMTRFIGHATSTKILAEARKRRLTVFNPDGTGMIAKQVKELLSITKPVQQIPVKELNGNRSVHVATITKGTKVKGKLSALIPFINYDKGNKENADVMMLKAKELGIETTSGSLQQLMVTQRRKLGLQTRVPVKSVKSVVKTDDVSVQILDGMIKGLQDMRAFIVETVEENTQLKNKLAKFRKMIED
jgi:hypothetical protein